MYSLYNTSPDHRIHLLLLELFRIAINKKLQKYQEVKCKKIRIMRGIQGKKAEFYLVKNKAGWSFDEDWKENW